MSVSSLVTSISAAAERRRVETTLGVLRLLAGTIIGALVVALAVPANPVITVLGSFVPLLLVMLGCAWLTRHGHHRLAAWTLTGLLFAAVTTYVVIYGGLMANNAVAYVVGMMIAGATLGTRAAVAFAALASVVCGVVVALELNGLLPPSLAPVTVVNAWIAITVTLVLAAVIHRMAIQSLDSALELSERSRAELLVAQRQSELRAQQGQALASLAERALNVQEAQVMCNEAAELVRLTLNCDRVLVVEVDDHAYVGVIASVGCTPDTAAKPALEPLLTALSHSARLPATDPAVTPVLAALGIAPPASGHCVAIHGVDKTRGFLAALLDRAADGEQPIGGPFLETVAALIGGFLERQRTAERAQRSQKLEVVGRLANGVAHDFNNLLQVMMGVSQELRSLHGDSKSVRALDDLDVACQQGALLTRQLLTFSRRNVQQDTEIDVGRLVDEITPVLRRLIGDDVRLVLERVAVALFVRADRGHLEQILLNLVVNAREAMPNGGTVELKVTDDGSEHVKFVITDTGQGMDEATLRRIFQPFFTTKATGTGLGLATVSDIVDRLGGRIAVRSDVGRGTSFEVRLPRLQGTAETTRPSPSTQPTATRRRRILLAEDHDLVRASAMRVLQRGGHEVTAVSDGREALALIEAGESFDLIVSDVEMPELGGRRLVQALDERALHVPTVLMSGQAEPPMELSPAMVSRVRFVMKPFSSDSLLAAAEACMRSVG